MKESRRSIFLLLTAFLLISVSLFYFLSHRTGNANLSGKLLKLPVSHNICRIILSGKDFDTLLLERNNEGGWLLNKDYHANGAAVKDLIFIAENLMVRAPVPVSEREGVASRLAYAGIKLEMYAETHRIRFGPVRLLPHVKRVADFQITDNEDDNTSVNVIIAGSAEPLVAHLPGYAGRPWLAFVPDRQLWQDPVIINMRYEDIRQVRVNVAGSDDESFFIDNDQVLGIRLRNLAGTALEEATINMHLVDRYLHSFNDLFYEQLVVGGELARKENSISKEPFIEVFVKTIEGKQVAIKCFRRTAVQVAGQPFPALTEFDPDRFYILVDDDYFVLAQYLVFGRVLRTLSFFRKNDAA